MQQNFATFFARVLEDEGTSYEDVAGDNGGPTKCGITIADVARWNKLPLPKRDAAGWDALVAKVRALTPATAGAIYKAYYWDAVRADELPSGLDYTVVDYAVNSGVGRAVPTLARLLGVKGGKMTDALIAAANAEVDLPHLIDLFGEEREAFLKSIAEVPHNRKFRKGWLAREARVRAVAMSMAKADTRPREVAKAPKPVVAAAARTPESAPNLANSTEVQAHGVVGTAGGAMTIDALTSAGGRVAESGTFSIETFLLALMASREFWVGVVLFALAVWGILRRRDRWHVWGV